LENWQFLMELYIPLDSPTVPVGIYPNE
jgi:hypothetical protein